MAKKHVLTQEQMRVYASPVRQRIVAALMARHEASISEIAGDLGRRADTLYHHVRLLLKVGILIKSGERIAGKNREAIYAPKAPVFSPDVSTTDQSYLQEFSRLVRIVLGDAASHHAQAFRQKDTRNRVFFETANVRLSADQIQWFNSELQKLIVLAKERADPEAERHLFAFVSTPVGKT